MTDYRAQAYKWAGEGREHHVNAIAASLHYNESLHLHTLGKEESQHGACEYCWLRAGRAVHALAEVGLLTATVPTSIVAPVLVGQIWADKYPGSKGRTVRVVDVDHARATIEVITEAEPHLRWTPAGYTLGRRTRVLHDHRGLRGYRLVTEPADTSQ